MAKKSPNLSFTTAPHTAADAEALPLTVRKQRKRRPRLESESGGEYAPARPLPRPHKQGSLDGLCGLYAIVNALRNACSSAGINRRISWSGLFQAMLHELDAQGRAIEVICVGIVRPLHDSCITVAKRYLRLKHGIRLKVRKPWTGRKRLAVNHALQTVGVYLREPGTAAMLGFAGSSDAHWTVIQEVVADTISLADSAGYRSLAIARFRFVRICNYHPAKDFLIWPNCLILIKVVPMRNSRWWDLSEPSLMTR